MRPLAHAFARLVVCLGFALLAGGPALAGGGAKSAEADKKLAAPETYLALDRMTATLVVGYEIRGLMQVEAGVDFKTAKQKRKAEAVLPRLRAACAQAVRDFAVDEYLPGRAPNADLLAERMAAAAEAELEIDGIQVLLSAVIVSLH